VKAEIDRLDADQIIARVEFEPHDAGWLSRTDPWSSLMFALRALDAKLCGKGRIPLHMEGYTRGPTIYVECWRFAKDSEPASFLAWRGPAARPHGEDVHVA
jgi:hypothetical protein